jgi:hypothetical protein
MEAWKKRTFVEYFLKSMWNVGFLVDFFTELPKCGVGGNHNVVRLSLKHNNHLDVHVCVCVRGGEGRGGEGLARRAQTQNNSLRLRPRPSQAELSRAKPGFRVVRVRSFIRSWFCLFVLCPKQQRLVRHVTPIQHCLFFPNKSCTSLPAGLGSWSRRHPKAKRRVLALFLPSLPVRCARGKKPINNVHEPFLFELNVGCYWGVTG